MNKNESLKCPNCGNVKIIIDEENDLMICDCCDTKHILSAVRGDSDYIRVEKMKAQAEKEKFEYQKEKDLKNAEYEEKLKYKKGKFGKAVFAFIIISAIFLFLCIVSGRILSAVISAVMLIAFVVAYLMGTKTIPEKKKGLKTIIAIIGFLLIIPMVACLGMSNNKSMKTEKIEWSEIVLADVLPELPAEKGSIYQNDSEGLNIDSIKIEEAKYFDYLAACKDKGFNIDEKKDSISFTAYNEDGYNLRLSFYDEEMSINLSAPMKMSEILWPDSVAGNKLPVPKSKMGKFNYEHEDNFYVYIGNTTKSDYNEYVSACEEKGFKKDYDKGDEYYRAYDAEGWKISLEYKGFNTMSIDITHPEKKTETEEKTVNNEEKTTDKTVHNSDSGSELRSDFKKAMDSYEEFMDEYVAFMKKYEESNGSDLRLVAQYGEMAAKYSQMEKDFEKWEDEDLTDSELSYYIEVQNRVNQKLLEVA